MRAFIIVIVIGLVMSLMYRDSNILGNEINELQGIVKIK